MSVVESIVINVISGVDWVAKLLEGWTNRLKKDGLICVGLKNERFLDIVVSAAKADFSIDKGREGSFNMEIVWVRFRKRRKFRR